MDGSKKFYEIYKNMFDHRVERLPNIRRLPLRSMYGNDGYDDDDDDYYPHNNNNRRVKKHPIHYLSNNYSHRIEDSVTKPWEARNRSFAGNYKKKDYNDMYSILRNEIALPPLLPPSPQESNGRQHKKRHLMIREEGRAAGLKQVCRKGEQDLFVPRYNDIRSYKDKLTETHMRGILNDWGGDGERKSRSVEVSKRREEERGGNRVRNKKTTDISIYDIKLHRRETEGHRGEKRRDVGRSNVDGSVKMDGMVGEWKESCRRSVNGVCECVGLMMRRMERNGVGKEEIEKCMQEKEVVECLMETYGNNEDRVKSVTECILRRVAAFEERQRRRSTLLKILPL